MANINYKDYTLVEAFDAGRVADHLYFNKNRYNKNELVLILSYVEQLWLGERTLDNLTRDYIRGIESKAIAREIVKNHKKEIR